MRHKFLRTQTHKFMKLGMRQKSRQKWRKAKGIHNKTRQRRAGKPRQVDAGFGRDRKYRGRINNKIPMLIKNMNDAEKIDKTRIAIISSLGKKKRQEILSKLNERNIEVLNK